MAYPSRDTKGDELPQTVLVDFRLEIAFFLIAVFNAHTMGFRSLDPNAISHAGQPLGNLESLMPITSRRAHCRYQFW